MFIGSIWKREFGFQQVQSCLGRRYSVKAPDTSLQQLLASMCGFKFSASLKFSDYRNPQMGLLAYLCPTCRPKQMPREAGSCAVCVCGIHHLALLGDVGLRDNLKCGSIKFCLRVELPMQLHLATDQEFPKSHGSPSSSR